MPTGLLAHHSAKLIFEHPEGALTLYPSSTLARSPPRTAAQWMSPFNLQKCAFAPTARAGDRASCNRELLGLSRRRLPAPSASASGSPSWPNRSMRSARGSSTWMPTFRTRFKGRLGGAMPDQGSQPNRAVSNKVGPSSPLCIRVPVENPSGSRTRRTGRLAV